MPSGRYFPKMIKVIIILLLILAISAPSYAVGAVDTMLCKKVILCANSRAVLVNRLTGEVKYVLKTNGQWKPLVGEYKNEYQAMYNAQLQNFRTDDK